MAYQEAPTLLDYMRTGARLSTSERMQRFINELTKRMRSGELAPERLKPVS